MIKGIYAIIYPFLVDVFKHFNSKLFGGPVPELYHLLKFPGGIYMQKGKGGLFGIKCFHGKPKHDRTVLTYGIKHNRLLTFCRNLPDDIDGLCFQLIQM